MDVIDETIVEHVLHRTAPHFRHCRIDVLDQAILNDDNGIVSPLHQVAIFLLALPQRLLGLPKLGDIGEDAYGAEVLPVHSKKRGSGDDHRPGYAPFAQQG